MKHILELQDVSKTYGTGATVVHAVQGVNLSVRAGEVVLIMGPSGSGKTTLLSIAGLLLRPSGGRIRMNEVDVTAMDERSLSALRLRQIGFVFQAYNLLAALSALENVELVLNMAGVKGKTARNRAAELLTTLGLGHRLHHLPANLSGGEKQRVAIARALANEPALILADEPTGNLDSKIGREVMELLCCGIGRDQGRGVVIVTHDQRLRDIADRVFWMEDGRLHEESDVAGGVSTRERPQWECCAEPAAAGA